MRRWIAWSWVGLVASWSCHPTPAETPVRASAPSLEPELPAATAPLVDHPNGIPDASLSPEYDALDRIPPEDFQRWHEEEDALLRGSGCGSVPCDALWLARRRLLEPICSSVAEAAEPYHRARDAQEDPLETATHLVLGAGQHWPAIQELLWRNPAALDYQIQRVEKRTEALAGARLAYEASTRSLVEAVRDCRVEYAASRSDDEHEPITDAMIAVSVARELVTISNLHEAPCERVLPLGTDSSLVVYDDEVLPFLFEGENGGTQLRESCVRARSARRIVELAEILATRTPEHGAAAATEYLLRASKDRDALASAGFEALTGKVAKTLTLRDALIMHDSRAIEDRYRHWDDMKAAASRLAPIHEIVREVGADGLLHALRTRHAWHDAHGVARHPFPITPQDATAFDLHRSYLRERIASRAVALKKGHLWAKNVEDNGGEKAFGIEDVGTIFLDDLHGGNDAYSHLHGAGIYYAHLGHAHREAARQTTCARCPVEADGDVAAQVDCLARAESERVDAELVTIRDSVAAARTEEQIMEGIEAASRERVVRITAEIEAARARAAAKEVATEEQRREYWATHTDSLNCGHTCTNLCNRHLRSDNRHSCRSKCKLCSDRAHGTWKKTYAGLGGPATFAAFIAERELDRHCHEPDNAGDLQCNFFVSVDSDGGIQIEVQGKGTTLRTGEEQRTAFEASFLEHQRFAREELDRLTIETVMTPTEALFFAQRLVASKPDYRKMVAATPEPGLEDVYPVLDLLVGAKLERILMESVVGRALNSATVQLLEAASAKIGPVTRGARMQFTRFLSKITGGRISEMTAAARKVVSSGGTASNAALREKLIEDLARESLDLDDIAGTLIARGGTRTPGGVPEFRDAKHYVEQFGGELGDWVKKKSPNYAPSGSRNLEFHWVENTRTGLRYADEGFPQHVYKPKWQTNSQP